MMTLNHFVLIASILLIYCTTSWKISLSILTGVCCIALFLLYKFQNKMLYLPQACGTLTPPPHSLPVQNVFLTTKDQVKLHCWFVPSQNDPRKSPTILFFHANAGTIFFRAPFLQLLRIQIQCNLMVPSYRGYGLSGGVPSEEGIKIDVETVFDHLVSRNDIDPSKIIIFGRSLGGAVAIYLSSKYSNQICGTIVENTFTSISDMVDQIMPVLAFLKSLILRVEWKNIDIIDRITHPILFISGESDELVPPAQMHRLYVKASSSKTLFSVPSGMHNDTWQKGGVTYYQKIQEFCTSCIAAGKQSNQLSN